MRKRDAKLNYNKIYPYLRPKALIWNEFRERNHIKHGLESKCETKIFRTIPRTFPYFRFTSRKNIRVIVSRPPIYTIKIILVILVVN